MTTKSEEDFVREIGRQAERRQLVRHGSVWQGLAQVATGEVGWSLFPQSAGALIGRWIDRYYATGIFWTLSIMFMGLALGCASAWRSIKKGTPRMNGILVAGLGFLLGLVYFGALWRSIHSLFVGRPVTAWLSLGMGGTVRHRRRNFHSPHNYWRIPGPPFSGLGGMLMARGYLIHTIGRQARMTSEGLVPPVLLRRAGRDNIHCLLYSRGICRGGGLRDSCRIGLRNGSNSWAVAAGFVVVLP